MRPLCPNAFCRAHRRIADGPGSDPDSQSPRPRAPRAYPALLTQMRPPRETAPGGLPWGARSRRVRKQLLQRPSTAGPLCSGEAKAVSSARLRSGSRASLGREHAPSVEFLCACALTRPGSSEPIVDRVKKSRAYTSIELKQHLDSVAAPRAPCSICIATRFQSRGRGALASRRPSAGRLGATHRAVSGP